MESNQPRRPAHEWGTWKGILQTSRTIPVAVLLMLNGARWLLHESPAAANELLVATCAIDSIVSDEGPLRVCTETPSNVH